MTPKGRERAYEKRRYEEWQTRLATKQARNRRLQRTTLAVLAALATVAVIGTGVILLLPKNDTPAAAAKTPAAACPTPTVKAPTTPKTFAKAPPASDAGGKTWQFTINSTCGQIVVALDGAKAPQAVSAMLLLAKSGFFDGSPCHRLVTSGIYVLQCGDPTGTGTGGPGFSYGPVENAPKANLYPAGTVAMARQGGNGKSMGSQFFLVYKDSTIPADAAGGYTVLGKITKGMDVVQKVAAGGVAGQQTDGAPVRAISITSTSVAAG